ncbi:MAG: class I SAM-dependent methyltransferase [Bryobacteraceae bacterium]
MGTSPSGIEDLKAKMRGTWMAGDFGQIARYSAQRAEQFVDRLPIQAGMRVLDVACGTGNLAIPAARRGADVTGVDIAPNLIEQAKQRANAEGLRAKFDEGDAEQLPYPDAEFDVVISMFGAMFAPRPDRVASELVRVCRKGGTIAMANWTPDVLAGKLFALSARYLPPPDGVPPPVLWGNEETVRQRFGNAVSSLKMARQPFAMKFPFPPRDTVQLFRQYFGPIRVTFSTLDEAAQAAYAKDLEGLWEEGNEAKDGTTSLSTEYLEVIATKA